MSLAGKDRAWLAAQSLCLLCLTPGPVPRAVGGHLSSDVTCMALREAQESQLTWGLPVTPVLLGMEGPLGSTASTPSAP